MTQDRPATRAIPALCSKRGYLSQREAIAALRWIKRHSRASNRRPVRAYRCDDCGCWHLTSSYKPRNFLAQS